MGYFDAKKYCREKGVENDGGCAFAVSGAPHIVFYDETTRQHEIDHVQCKTEEHEVARR